MVTFHFWLNPREVIQSRESKWVGAGGCIVIVRFFGFCSRKQPHQVKIKVEFIKYMKSDRLMILQGELCSHAILIASDDSRLLFKINRDLARNIVV